MNERLTISIQKDDLDNPYQRKDAAETVAHRLVDAAYKKSVGWFLEELTSAYWWTYRNTDARTKEVRHYMAAREKMVAAAHEFDKARAVLKEKGTK